MSTRTNEPLVTENATHTGGTLQDSAVQSAASWASDPCGRLISIDWSRWLTGSKPVDPYLVWADVSRFRGMGGWPRPTDPEQDGRWPILVECVSDDVLDLPGTLAKPAKECADCFASLDIPGLYKTVSKERLQSRFFTARMLPESVEQLLCSPAIARFQLGLPRINGVDPNSYIGGTPMGGRAPRVVIGIIDDGCAFAHPAFCDDLGNSRVHFLWDQDPARTLSVDPNGKDVDPEGKKRGWLGVKEAGYGAEIQHKTLCEAVKAGLNSGCAERAYEAINYGPLRLEPGMHGTMFRQGKQILPAGSMRWFSHGASVMYLAAGVEERVHDNPQNDERNPDLSYLQPLKFQRAVAGIDVSPTQVGLGQLQTDHATQWPIIFVQLPTRSILDTSGGSLGVHVLDGLEYIVNRAKLLEEPPSYDRSGHPDDGSRSFPPPDAPADSFGRVARNPRVVISVSYGAVAGPHDGTSIIERAMAALVDRQHYTWICLAAGNAHRTKTHARMTLEPGVEKSFLWTVPPDNPLQSFLEIWLPEQQTSSHDLPEAQQSLFTVSVHPPAGYPSCEVTCGGLSVCEVKDAFGRPHAVAASIFSRKVVQGLRGTMVLIAVGATRPEHGDDRPVPCHGDWVVDVLYGRSIGNDPAALGSVVVHAWSERNDLLFGNQRAQQARVVSADPIPEPTEFMPEAMRFRSSFDGQFGKDQMLDDAQPRNSLGSLSGLRLKPHLSGFSTSVGQKGQLAVIGAVRQADGEVSDYSSGGPNRHAEPTRGTSGLEGAGASAAYASLRTSGRLLEPVDRPDASAPADIGPAMRGLRTAGMRAGSYARLSGTSAAAPSAARLIANVQYGMIYYGTVKTQEEFSSHFGLRPSPSKGTAPADLAARPTATPAKDDQHRLGKWWIK
jgi:hypothetical protein